MPESEEHIEFQYEVAEKYALVQEGRMAVALLPDMEKARKFVERSDRYSMETPPGSNVVSIQYPVHVLEEASDDA